MAAANVQVVELAPREMIWAREFKISRQNAPATVDDLVELRSPLTPHLTTQLPFWAKVSFKMTIVIHNPNPWGDEEVEDVLPAYGGYDLLQPAPWKVSPNGDPDRRMAAMISAARQKLEIHLERARFRGSRDIIGHIEAIYLLVAPSGEMARLPGPAVAEDRPVGAKIHEMPEGLGNKRGVWNPQNEDTQCFQWCVRAHMAGIESWSSNDRKKAAKKVRDRRFYLDGYAPAPNRPAKGAQVRLNDFGLDFSTLPTDRGVVWTDIDAFEAANHGKMVRGPTVEDAPIQILLLRVVNHFMLIFNFNNFCSNRSAELDGSRRLTTQVFACHRCGGSFKSAETLVARQEKPCSRDPAKRFSPIRMPNVSKNEHRLRYKAGNSAELAPLVLFADLETWTEEAPNVQVQEISHGIQRNVASAAFMAVTRNGFEVDQADKIFVTHAEIGEHRFAVVERFLRKSLALAKSYKAWAEQTNVMAKPTDLQWRHHQEAVRCERCNIAFREGDSRRMKVCHHRHGTGEYLEALCATCNKGIRQPPCVPVFFHNGGSFDFGFLIRAIAYLRGGGSTGQPQEVMVEDEQLPATEDLDEEADFSKLTFQVLFKSGEKLLQFRFGNLVFRDSMNFYKQGLGDLISELKKTAPQGNASAVFPHVALTHPDLNEDRLTEERRRRLWLHFASDKDAEGWRDCPMEVWQAAPVWSRQCYDSKLDPDTQQARRKKDEAYQLLVETAAIMGWRTFREMHDAYLVMDLALSDVMEAFRGAFFRRFRVDALQYITLPGAAFDAMLLKSTVHRPINLIVEEEIYRVVRRSVMGGLSCIFQPYAKANHPGLDDFDSRQPQSYILPLDVNSMYPGLMTHPLPCDSGEMIALPQSQEERFAWLEAMLDGIDFQARDEEECYLVVIDFDFPAEYHDQLDWAPPARMKVTKDMLGEHSLRIAAENGCDLRGSEKLVPYLGRHIEEDVDAKRLQFMQEVMRARVRKIHAAIKFRCSKALAPWMQWCYDERIRLKKAGHPIEAEAVKLAMNSIYGKLIQNVEGYRSAGVHTD
ncbi:unnamed protein product, partial [Symbiodinium necroappetens]